jgi:spermidine synthase
LKNILRRLLFLLFFLSGFCSLAYQIIWLRLAFASFGVITPVLSVVVSVFMAGIFVGTLAAGKWIRRLTKFSKLSAIYFYALVEIVVACGAFAVPKLFAIGESSLLSVGESNSFAYLFYSALIIAGSLFPWCVAMGATIPCMLAYLRERKLLGSGGFSFLYLANVLGALAGVFLTSLILIESLGFKRSLDLAAVTNALIGLGAILIGLSEKAFTSSLDDVELEISSSSRTSTTIHPALNNSILFFTGFASMAMEVVWSRAFTPIISTQVYSFALILFTYLLATFLGSSIYRRHLAKGQESPVHELLAWLIFSTTLPLLLNDPRFGGSPIMAIFSIFPFCLGLGYLTPSLIDHSSQGDPSSAAKSYAINILGSCLGPLLASYLLLPSMGVKGALLVLSFPFLLLYLGSLALSVSKSKWLIFAAGCALMLFNLSFIKTHEDPGQNNLGPWEIRRDSTATVISCGEGKQRRLLVNGIDITFMTSITKVMAHLPLCFLEKKPSSALDICFGIGTTFRALSSWGIPTTAVELVPSVRDAFGFYFEDAQKVLARPETKVVIDDGRRFLSRSQERYDLITVDPPPPVEAAASSLLYSEEFYTLAKAHLNEGGLLQQWVPWADPRTVQAMVHSLMNTFPYVRVFQSYQGWGYHFLASSSPLKELGADAFVKRMPPAAQRDLMEWIGSGPAIPFMRRILSSEMNPQDLAGLPGRGITDDRPFNEYYLLRTLFPALGPSLN